MTPYIAAIKAGYRGRLTLVSQGREVEVVGGYPPTVKNGPDWQVTGQQLHPTGYPIGMAAPTPTLGAV